MGVLPHAGSRPFRRPSQAAPDAAADQHGRRVIRWFGDHTMLTYLLEHPYRIYFLLTLIGAVLVLAWWRTRRWKFLVGVIGVAGVYVVFAVFTILNETPHQQIDRKIHEMTTAIAAHDLDRAFAHISDDFAVNNVNKAGLRRMAEMALRQYPISEVPVWDVQWPESEPYTLQYRSGSEWRKAPGEKVAFEFKVKSSTDDPGYWLRCEAIFVQDPDDQWRMKSFELFRGGPGGQKLNYP
jgi:hypothetical protein